MSNDIDVTDSDMPDGMEMKHGEGDLEEEFADVMADIDPREVVSPAPRRGSLLDDANRSAGANVDRLEDMASQDQGDAGRQAVEEMEQADEAAASAVSFRASTFDAGLDLDFGVTD